MVKSLSDSMVSAVAVMCVARAVRNTKKKKNAVSKTYNPPLAPALTCSAPAL